MTKADIVQQVYEKLGTSKKESGQVVESVFSIVKETLENGENVKVSGFGNFIVRNKNSRKGRNPQKGEEIYIAESKVPKFVAGKALKEAVK